MGKSNTDLNRRQFLKSSAVAVTAIAAVGAGVGYIRIFFGHQVLYLRILLFMAVLNVVYVFKFVLSKPLSLQVLMKDCLMALLILM